MSLRDRSGERRPATVAIVTLGCPKNLVDSEVMAALVGRAGFVLTGDMHEADAIVINTCAFIRAAREEAWRYLEQAVRLRRKGRCRALVAAGCLAQGFADEVRATAPEVDALLGTGEVGEVVRVLEEVLEGSEPRDGASRRVAPGRTAGRAAAPRVRGPSAPPGWLPSGPAPRLLGTPGHYAYLKIAEGCDHRCAFCLIPSLRGRYRSRPLDDLLREARDLEEAGVRELVLVAQDTTLYGRGTGVGLTGLLRRLLAETGIGWLRVLYGCPSTLPADLPALLAEQAAGGGRRLCRYLDLPMQHASDRVLRAMRRPETGDFLLKLVSDLRSEVEDLTLRSTFMIGFPGETDEDFEVLLDFLEAARLDHCGFFAFSPEPGTRAAGLPGRPDAEVTRERLARAVEVQRKVALDRRRRLVGRELKIIVDEVGPEERGLHTVTGRWEGDAPEIDGVVRVRWPSRPGDVPSVGDFTLVEVTGAEPYGLKARPVQRPGR
ncbi:MAG TPA: 30S ribosomal protein S12 methylthiotransferase RimO [Clostridiales bacterium]|nr:30S ribosomal protein S12 methylthiotransferase RimO [Clostridiales bacterium]